MFYARVAWVSLVCLLLCKGEGSSPVSVQEGGFISEDSIKRLGREIQPFSRSIYMTLTTVNTSITGCCTITLTLGDDVYNGIRLSVLRIYVVTLYYVITFRSYTQSLTSSSRILRLVPCPQLPSTHIIVY